MSDVVEVTQKSQEIMENGENNDLWPGVLSEDEKQKLAYISAQYGLDPFFGEMIVLGGNPYVTSSGLKRNAYEDEDPPISIQLEKVESSGDRHFEYKARLWKESTPENRPYIEYGEASPEDCNSQISSSNKDLKAMARTRATNRVIRLAYNVSITSAEELSGYDPDSQEIKDVSGQPEVVDHQGENYNNSDNSKNSIDNPGEFIIPFGYSKGEKLKNVNESTLKWASNLNPSNEKGQALKDAAIAYIKKKEKNENSNELSKRQKKVKKLIDGDNELREEVITFKEVHQANTLDDLDEEAFNELINFLEDLISGDDEDEVFEDDDISKEEIDEAL